MKEVELRITIFSNLVVPCFDLRASLLREGGLHWQESSLLSRSPDAALEDKGWGRSSGRSRGLKSDDCKYYSVLRQTFAVARTQGNTSSYPDTGLLGLVRWGNRSFQERTASRPLTA